MRTIGIDLAITGEHRAIVADEQGRPVSPVLKFRTVAREMLALLATARPEAADSELQAVMEPTGMAWFPVAVFLIRQGVRVYLVNSQRVAALRRFYSPHAKADRIDARVLVRLPIVSPGEMHPLCLSLALTLACQRACKQANRLLTRITAIQNRLQAVDRFAWPGLEQSVFSEPFCPAARWFRQNWYHPQRVREAGTETIRAAWLASGLDPTDKGTWVEALVELAEQVLELYGPEGTYLDFEQLQHEVQLEQKLLVPLEEEHHRLQVKVIRPLYRQIHPSRNLETIKGVGQDGAAVYASFAGDVSRFASMRQFRSWSGMVPASKQSSESEAKGLHVTQAGPALVKKYIFMGADVARRYDPQMAAVYYNQMVKRGKHHKQAVCACAAHQLDRVLTVLREDRPFELRDVDGTPVTEEQALAIIAERYTVPDEVRKHNNKRYRRERAEKRAEKQQERESRLSLARGKHVASPKKSQPSQG